MIKFIVYVINEHGLCGRGSGALVVKEADLGPEGLRFELVAKATFPTHCPLLT